MLLYLTFAIVASVQAINENIVCRGIEKLQLSNENGVLYATWSPSEDLDVCYTRYKVDVYVNNILVKSDFATKERFEVMDEKPCTVVKVRLSDSYSSKVVEDSYIPDIGSVKTINFEGNIAKWEVPESFTHCTYKVDINDGKDWVNQETHTYDVSGLKLTPCLYHTFTVTPVGYDLTKGDPLTITFMTGMDIPNAYIQEEKYGDQKTHVVWTDLGHACKYSVKLDDVLVYNGITEHDVILDTWEANDCRTHKITVQAYSDLQTGEPIELFYEQEPSSNFEGLENVVAVTLKHWVSIYWDLNNKLKYCDMSYNIKCSINEGSVKMDFDVRDIAPYVLEKCTVDSFTNTLEVWIQPVYHSTYGRTLLCQYGINYATGATYAKGCEYVYDL